MAKLRKMRDIIPLIEANKRVKDIAEHFNVSEATIYRYKKCLFLAGVEVPKVKAGRKKLPL